MAVNNSLITGAGTAADKFTDIGGAFTAGATSGTALSASSLPQKRQAIKYIDSQVKGYIDSLNTDLDLVGLSNQEQGSVRGFLDTKRMEYADLATQLTQTDATSPYYSELKSKMDGIKSSFVGLGKQIENFKQRKVEYLDDFDNGRLSKGNNPESYDKAAKVYAGGALSIDSNGELYVVTDDGKEITKYSEIKDPFLKSFDVADKIADQSLKLYNAAEPISEPKKNLLRNDLKTMLSESGALESIVEDGLIGNQPLNVDLDAYPTREDAIDDVAEILLQGYIDSAADGAKEKRNKKGGTNPANSDSTIANTNGTYPGYNRNTEQDRVNFENNWDNTQSTAARSAEVMNYEASDPKVKSKIDYYRGFAPGSAIFGKDGKLTEPPRDEEVRVQKWYSSYDSTKYGGEAKTNQRWQLAPAIKWTEDGYKPVTIWRRNSKDEWKVLTKEDYKKELRGKSIAPQTSTDTSSGGAAQFNNNQSN